MQYQNLLMWKWYFEKRGENTDREAQKVKEA